MPQAEDEVQREPAVPAREQDLLGFDAAQAADPFDPTPLLIRADWLEERGDFVSAEALRGLAAGGYPSLVAIALEAARDCPLSEAPWAQEGGGPGEFNPDFFAGLSGDVSRIGPKWGAGWKDGAGTFRYGAGVGLGDRFAQIPGFMNEGEGGGDDHTELGEGRGDADGFEDH